MPPCPAAPPIAHVDRHALPRRARQHKAFDGPDDVENGLCLCSLHHKLFDKGVLGLGEGHRILVSQSFAGRSTAAREHVITLAGRPVIGPRPGVRPIAADHRSWHTGQVFHGSSRPATTA